MLATCAAAAWHWEYKGIGQQQQSACSRSLQLKRQDTQILGTQ
jgi:hypothetical protein